ncbi:MAG TPA: M20/M25/M40 family metallo-hydrolase, partial [Marmoricola sp.]|nr:M20/M25/M40 family metallo-hydrolase [Marmoricola sp.]
AVARVSGAPHSIAEIVAPDGVTAEVSYIRGVPPVVNETVATRVLGGAIEQVVGEENRFGTAQSLGGEDFAWFVEQVPGAMARLGTRTPGGPTFDLHQGDLNVDERAIGLAAKVLATAAIRALVTTT